jgi:hypothetical protein
MSKSLDLGIDIEKHFYNNKISTLDDIKTVVNTTSTMTVYRALSRLGYISSYSHRGRYYTLAAIPDYDHYGLWSYHSVMFSKYGNLLETAAFMVQNSDAGFTASELEALLQVEVKHALLKLLQRERVSRSKLKGRFVYLSADSVELRRQILLRRDCTLGTEVGRGMEAELLPDELKAGIILFFSLLDEKQRRLYAGLEAAKLGYGGDHKISELLGLDPHTVSKGRQELFSGSVDRSIVRKSGGGRKRVEKKHLK